MDIKPLKKIKSVSPKVIFREEAYFDLKKMMSSTLAKDTEFMCFGMVEKVTERKEYIISRFYLIPNKNNSGAYCEADEERLNEFYSQFPIADRRKIRCHCHSHVNMPTSPSGTDAEQGEDFAASVSDYFIQLIINHKDINTANILNSSTGMGYYKVPMYIQIGNYAARLKESEKDEMDICGWNEETGLNQGDFEIPDGDYKIVDGWMAINENLFFYTKDKDYYLVGEHMQIDSTTILLHKEAITEEMKKEINDAFTKFVKKKTYAYQSTYDYKKGSTDKKSDPYHKRYSSILDDDFDYDPRNDYGGYYGGYYGNSQAESEYYNGMKTGEKKDNKEEIKPSDDAELDEAAKDFKDFLSVEDAKKELLILKKKYPTKSIDDICGYLWDDIMAVGHKCTKTLSVERSDLGKKGK